MRKKLLTLGALALAMSMDAQILTYVGNKGKVFVKENALVYNGGGMKIKGGVVDNSGNVMIVGGANDKFVTQSEYGNDVYEATHIWGYQNFILRMTNQDLDNLRYGQLYISGLTQDNITGVVSKEYKDKKHGEYQQMAVPFYKKTMADLAGDLGLDVNSVHRRWSKNEILVWNNMRVRFDQLLPGKFHTTDDGDKVKEIMEGVGTADGFNQYNYYAIGSSNFDASDGVKIINGVPYSDIFYSDVVDVRSNVNDWGTSPLFVNKLWDLEFGENGNGRNKYRELYNTYLQDELGEAMDGAWKGNYGHDIVQLGNPFLTNLDLAYFVQEIEKFEPSPGLNRSGKFGFPVGAIRVEAEGVTTTNGSGYANGFVSQSTSAKYIMFDENGKAVGDMNAVIKPMQTFVIKFTEDISGGWPVIRNFGKFRRFAYEPQDDNAATVTTGLKTASTARTNNTLRTASVRSLSTTDSYVIKQLGVIALDDNGKELGRTYYYVSPKAITGSEVAKTKRQITASTNNIIGTFEENKQGGLDEEAANRYWLYINGANENDFKGKEVPLALYSDAIKSLKFEIREDAKLIADNATLSNGESFYIKAENGELKELRNGMTIPSTANYYGLFYGNPNVKEEKVEEPVVVANRETTELVYDVNTGEYKLLFASDWNTATIQVLNSRGRVVSLERNVNAKSDYVVKLPDAIGTYIVRVNSDKNVNFTKKVLKN